MVKKGITYSETVECAEVLLNEGIKITANNIRRDNFLDI